MRQEVFLEIVYQVYRLMEERLVFASVHQYGFGSEHLGNLGQDARSALCYEIIAECSDERIGRYAAKAVASAALQSHAQVAQRHRRALVLCGLAV